MDRTDNYIFYLVNEFGLGSISLALPDQASISAVDQACERFVHDDFYTTRLLLDIDGIQDVEVKRRRNDLPVRLGYGRRNRSNGRYPSIKLGRSIPYESQLELHDMYRAEVDPQVVSYFGQPETLLWQSGGKSYRYTPDRRDELDDGSTRIVEVKPDLSEERHEKYIAKLSQAKLIYAAVGVQLVVHDASCIMREPTLSAAEEIQAYRRTIVTVADFDAVRRLLAHGPMPMSDVIAATPSDHPRATVLAMMPRRHIKIDLDAGLKPDAAVSLVSTAD